MEEYLQYLPLAYLNALEYCPRRFYYEYVQGEMIVNYHVLKGAELHDVADEPGMESIEGGVRRRRLIVWSHRLKLTGIADLVELSNGELCPIEYKKGKMGRWLNDHVQLCAQALCLEEMFGQSVRYGYVFYFGSARRQRVEFTPDLRLRTEAAVAEARQLAQLPSPPPPITNYNKCRDCSLEPMCMPREVRTLRRTDAMASLADE
jgi:CRISPR-associated exonuclease Cas4